MMQTALCAILMGLSALGAQPLGEPELVWETPLGARVTASPTLFPSADAPSGVLTGVEDGRLILIDGNGNIVWERQLGAAVSTVPAAGDVTGDGRPDIVTATLDRRLVVLSAEGEVLWEADLTGVVNEWRGAVLADLTGDDTLEIVVGDNAGWQMAFGGNGEWLWRLNIDPFRTGLAAVTGSGSEATIFYGTENDHIAATDPQGRVVWISEQEGQFGRSAPTLGDITGDGQYELAIIMSFNTPNSRVICLNAHDGTLKWESPVRLHGYAAIGMADLDGDGMLEVLLGERSNMIYAINGDGSHRWATHTGGRSYFWPPSVADITGDGRCEVIAGVRDDNEDGDSWFVLDDAGNLLGAYPMPGGANGAALVADIDGDGRTNVILPGFSAGLVRCYTFGGPSGGARREWTVSRHDAARRGVVPLSPEPPAPRRPDVPRLEAGFAHAPRWGGNALAVQWPAQMPETVFAEVSVVNPLGQRTTRVHQYRRDNLPETVPAELLGAGRHEVSLYVFGKAGQDPVGEWDGAADLGRFAEEAPALAERLGQLETAAAGLVANAPHSAQLLRELRAKRLSAAETLAARIEAAALNRMVEADAILAGIHALEADIANDLALARRAVAVQQTKPGARFALWETPNPWDNNPPLLDAAAPATEAEVALWMFGSEAESRAVHLVNLGADPLAVQVRPDEAAIERLSLYDLVSVPRPGGQWIPDALSPLAGMHGFNLAPGEVRTLWLTVHSHGLPPGETEFALDLLPLGASAPEGRIRVRAEVLGIDLAGAPVFRACNWSSPRRYRSDNLDPDESIELAKRHGINVFTSSMPGRRADAQGNLIGEADWSSLEWELDLVGPEGFMLLHGFGVPTPEGAEEYGPVHVKAQRAWLTELTEFMNAKGWERRWALYPVDEPGLFGGTGITVLARIGNHFKEALPGVPLYANPAGGVTVENMAPLVPIVDYWCPEQQLLRREPHLAEFFLATGKPVWSYEAPPLVKSLLPLGYYRANPWMGFQLGLSGGGFWTQYYGGNDLWLAEDEFEYGANYAVAGREVISRRWEAFRDGLEDARAFRWLEDLARAAREANRNRAAAARAERLLRETIPAATAPAWPSNDITRELRDYELDYEDVKAVREELRELLAILGANQHN